MTREELIWEDRKSKNEYCQKHRKKYPWAYRYYSLKARCETPTDRAYRFYGGRGIKCLITKEQVKFLWIRDKAEKMKCPSIDRINPDGHYELSNCQFIEKLDNVRKARPHRIPIFSRDVTTGEEVHYASFKEAERLGFSGGNIRTIIDGKTNRKTHKGKTWHLAIIEKEGGE